MDENWKFKIKFWMKEYQIEKIDLNLFMEALTHSSFKGMGHDVKDNERLEFLGDSVLDLLISHLLFLNSPLSEGEMTEKRKNFVSNEKLALIFDSLKLNKLVRTANDFNLSEKNKADFIEAIFGAVFLNKGYERCCEFWEIINERIGKSKNINSEEYIDKKIELQQKELFNKNMEEWELSDQDLKLALQIEVQSNKNAKNVLQEYCQRRSLPIPKYKLISREGSDHKPTFAVKVSIQMIVEGEFEKQIALGKGNTKKTAEFKAAEKICDFLKLSYTQ